MRDQHEATVGSNWRFEPERADHVSRLRGIAGFRFQVERIEMKFKLSQNHLIDSRIAVAERLDAFARESSRAVAAQIRERTSTGAE